jgi:hypothetical protein
VLLFCQFVVVILPSLTQPFPAHDVRNDGDYIRFWILHSPRPNPLGYRSGLSPYGTYQGICLRHIPNVSPIQVIYLPPFPCMLFGDEVPEKDARAGFFGRWGFTPS